MMVVAQTREQQWRWRKVLRFWVCSEADIGFADGSDVR